VYEIRVTTGYAKDAATDSRVYVRITGDYGVTDDRHLYSNDEEKLNFKTLRSGQTDSFIMTTRRCVTRTRAHARLCAVGWAKYIRYKCGMTTVVWARLRDGIVHVLSSPTTRRVSAIRSSLIGRTGRIRTHTVSRRWLSVDDGDGKISRNVPLSTRLELNVYRTMVERNAKKELRDGHLW
jgi:hypothetical protein